MILSTSKQINYRQEAEGDGGHLYDRLEVTGELHQVFDTGGEHALDRAVEHLDSVREGRLGWLKAVSKVKVGRTRLQVNALLTWEQIVGRSEAEIWALFDQYTTSTSNTFNTIFDVIIPKPIYLTLDMLVASVIQSFCYETG